MVLAPCGAATAGRALLTPSPRASLLASQRCVPAPRAVVRAQALVRAVAEAEAAVPFSSDSDHLEKWDPQSWRAYTALQQPEYPDKVRHCACVPLAGMAMNAISMHVFGVCATHAHWGGSGCTQGLVSGSGGIWGVGAAALHAGSTWLPWCTCVCLPQ